MEFMEITSLLGFAMRLGISVLAGFVIGFERQWTRHPAGILTNVIVCMGSFIFSSFSFIMNAEDPTRIAAQVVSGIGFLGAGVILREGLNIRGLNTAATIWATSAVGVMCCAKNISFALIAGGAIVAANVVFHPVAKYVTRKRFHSEDKRPSVRLYSISVISSDEDAPLIREKFLTLIKNEKSVLLRNLETRTMDDDNIKIKAQLSALEKEEIVIEKIIAKIALEEGVMQSSWKKIE